MGILFSTSKPPPISLSEFFINLFWIWVACSTLKRFLDDKGIHLGNTRQHKKDKNSNKEAESLCTVIGLKTVKREIHYFLYTRHCPTATSKVNLKYKIRKRND